MGRDDSRGDVGIAWSPAWSDGAVALILHRDNHRKWDDAKENSIRGWVFIFFPLELAMGRLISPICGDPGVSADKRGTNLAKPPSPNFFTDITCFWPAMI